MYAPSIWYGPVFTIYFNGLGNLCEILLQVYFKQYASHPISLCLKQVLLHYFAVMNIIIIIFMSRHVYALFMNHCFPLFAMIVLLFINKENKQYNNMYVFVV